MEKAMAPHSSTLAWKIPWTEEPGRLQSMGSPRVGHDWATSLSLFTFIHWRRKWQPTVLPHSLGFSRQEYWSGLPFPSPMYESKKWKWSCSVMSDSQRPHGLQPTGLRHPWEFPGESTGAGCHCLLWLHSIYSYDNIVAIFPMLYNTSLSCSLSYIQ